MIVDHDWGSVGGWDAMRPRPSPGLDQEAALAEPIAFCEVALSVLIGEELLRPNFLQIEGWRERDSGVEVERSPVASPLSFREGSSDIAGEVRELVAAHGEGGRLLPSKILVDGDGVIVRPGGVEDEQPDVFRVWCEVAPTMLEIELTTQSDAWLPYTLSGEPQPEVCPLVSTPSGNRRRFRPVAGFTVQTMGPMRAVHPALPRVVTLATRGLQGGVLPNPMGRRLLSATLAQRG